jgi:hypothetical protein
MIDQFGQNGPLDPPAHVQQSNSISERTSRLRARYEAHEHNKLEMGQELNDLKEQCIQENKEWHPVLAQTGIPVSTANKWMLRAYKKLHPQSDTATRSSGGQDEEEIDEGEEVEFKPCRDCRMLLAPIPNCKRCKEINAPQTNGKPNKAKKPSKNRTGPGDYNQ